VKKAFSVFDDVEMIGFFHWLMTQLPPMHLIISHFNLEIVLISCYCDILCGKSVTILSVRAV